MSAGGEHLKDEVSRLSSLLFTVSVSTVRTDLFTNIGAALSGCRRGCNSGPGVAVRISLSHLSSRSHTNIYCRFCIAPLDVVKIRLQLQTHSLSDATSTSQGNIKGPIYKGILGTLRTIFRDESITGLWKGNIPAEFLCVFYGAIQFASYRNFTLLLHSLPAEHRLPSSAESFIAGAGAGGLATATTYPLDLLRTRFAAQGNVKVYTSILSSVRDITRNEGPKGFFRGATAAVGQILPYMGIFFTVYEALRVPIAGMELPFGSGDAASGVIASVLAKTSVFPLDLVRKRLQVQGPTRSQYVHGNIPECDGVMRTVRMIVARQGVRGLYRGLTVSLVKAAPTSAVTMWTYERSLKLFKEWDIKL